jgi:hypothetical protein
MSGNGGNKGNRGRNWGRTQKDLNSNKNRNKGNNKWNNNRNNRDNDVTVYGVQVPSSGNIRRNDDDNQNDKDYGRKGRDSKDIHVGSGY